MLSRPFGSALLLFLLLLLLRGGVNVDDVLPHRLGASLLLGGSDRGLALLGGLCHRGGGLVLVTFLVGCVVIVTCVVRVCQ